MPSLGYLLDYQGNLSDLILSLVSEYRKISEEQSKGQRDLFGYMLLHREVVPPQGETQEEGIKFWYFEKQEPFKSWSYGRIFSPAAELRWQKREENYYHLTLLLCQDKLQDKLALPHGFQFYPLQPAKDENGKEKNDSLIFLWGEGRDFYEGKDLQYAWYEERIPHLISYPVKGKPKQVALKIKEYLLEGDSEHHLSSPIYHYKGVIGINE